jgi:hypothetical protein
MRNSRDFGDRDRLLNGLFFVSPNFRNKDSLQGPKEKI